MSSKWEWGCFELINWSGDCTVSDSGCCQRGENLTEPKPVHRGKPCCQAPNSFHSRNLYLLSFSSEDEPAWFGTEWTHPVDLQTSRSFVGQASGMKSCSASPPPNFKVFWWPWGGQDFADSWSSQRDFWDPSDSTKFPLKQSILHLFRTLVHSTCPTRG